MVGTDGQRPYRGERAKFARVGMEQEQWRLRRCWTDVAARRMVGAAVLANAATYLVLTAFWVVRLSLALAE